MSIRIELNEEWLVLSDKDQYILTEVVERTSKETGDKYKVEVPRKFFTKIENLLNHVPEFMSRQENHTSLASLVDGRNNWIEFLKGEL